MFKLTIYTLLFLLSTMCHAQFSVSGTVKTNSGDTPLANATVRLDDFRITVTDNFGHFSLNKVSSGPHVLSIRFLGYVTKELELTIESDEVVEITMEESTTLTDEVIVSATRVESNGVYAYSTVSKDQIEKQNLGQDLPILLNWTPSVVTTSDAGAGVGYTGIRIRGSDATNINVTINGIPYNDSESLGTFWVDIPDIAASSQSIQIQRGVGTSTNGGGAFGASINLQTNTRNDSPYAELNSAGGSFGTFRNALSFGSGLLGKHWTIDGRISKIVSDGFIDRATSDLTSYYLSAGYYGDKTIIKAITFAGNERTYQAWYGVPESRLNNDTEAMETTALNEGWNEIQTNNLLNSDSRTFNPYLYENEVDDYRQDNFQLHFSRQLSDNLTLSSALHYTSGAGFYEQFRYDDDIADYGLPDNGGPTSSDLVRRKWLDNDFYGLTYSLQYQKVGLNAAFGGAWNRYDGDHFGEIIWSAESIAEPEYRYYFNNGVKTDFNVYSKTSFRLGDKITAFVDLQYRGIRYDAAGIESELNSLDIHRSYDFFNPKLGLSADLSESSVLYASYSEARREPVRSDFVDYQGDAPEHEKLRDIEMGLRKTKNWYVLNFNAYAMLYRNQLVFTGALNDVGAPIRTNADKSHRVGVEAEAVVKVFKQLSWNVNLTVSQNRINEFSEVIYDYGQAWDEYNIVERNYANTTISFSPSLVAGSQLSYRPFQGGEIALLSKYVGQQYLDNTENRSRSLDPYFVHDVRVSYETSLSFIKQLRVTLLLNNVANVEYESNGYTWGYRGGGYEFRENYYYPQAGFNVLAMVTIRI